MVGSGVRGRAARRGRHGLAADRGAERRAHHRVLRGAPAGDRGAAAGGDAVAAAVRRVRVGAGGGDVRRGRADRVSAVRAGPQRAAAGHECRAPARGGGPLNTMNTVEDRAALLARELDRTARGGLWALPVWTVLLFLGTLTH